jgi:hypothetical protein
VEVKINAFVTSALQGGEWSASRPGRFTSRERAPGTHWIGGWVGPRDSLDTVMERKIPSPCRDSNPPIIKPVMFICRNIKLLKTTQGVCYIKIVPCDMKSSVKSKTEDLQGRSQSSVKNMPDNKRKKIKMDLNKYQIETTQAWKIRDKNLNK